VNIAIFHKKPRCRWRNAHLVQVNIS